MTPGPVPPEWHILLPACAPPAPGAGARLRHALHRNTSDWNRIVECAREHDLGPRLYDGLRSSGVLDEVPAPARVRLQEQYFATAIRNTVLLRELTHLLGALGSQGTPVILLKGAALLAR